MAYDSYVAPHLAGTSVSLPSVSMAHCLSGRTSQGPQDSQPSMPSHESLQKGHICGCEWFISLFLCWTHWKFGRWRVKCVCLGHSLPSPALMSWLKVLALPSCSARGPSLSIDRIAPSS